MKVGELFVVLDTKLDRFYKGMSDAERAMVKVGTRFAAIGKKLTMMVTLPILAVGAGAVKAFADFDKAMTESLAIMGPISDSMRQKMSDVAKTISEETTFAASELAESYYYLASAGMTAEQSVAALDKVAKFAQAGAFDLATATDLLTDAQTAMGLSSKDAVKNQENLVKVSDVLVGANTLANASVQQFSESLTNMAAAALTNANKGLEEGVAILAAFADKGIKGQKAGMKLSMMLNALDKAASKNKEAWKKYNVQLWDAEGNMRNVGNIIGDLETAFRHLTPEAKAAAMAELGFDVRVKNSILSLMGSSEKILQWTEDLKGMAGITEEVANKQMKAFSNQLTVVKNMLVNVGAEIGEILVPVLKNLIDNHIKPAIEWFKGLTDGQKEMIVRVAGLAAALGPLLFIFGKLLIVIPKISRALKLLAASPIGLVITGLVVIAEKTRQAINTFKDFSESLNKYLDASGKKMSWFEKTWSGLTATIHKHVYGVDVAKIATQKYAEMTDTARKKQAELAKTTLDAIKKTGLHTKAIDSLKSAFGFLIPKIKDTKSAEEILDSKTKDLTNTIKDVVQVIENDFGRAGRNMADVLEWMGTSIGTTVIPAMRDLTGVLYNVQGSLQDLTIEERKYLEKSKAVTAKVKSAWQEVSTVMSDMAKKWADTAVEMLGIAEYFTYEMKEFNNSIYESAAENAEKEYEERKKWIEENITDAEKRSQMLDGLEREHQAEMEKLRIQEDQAREQHAIKEEKRQSSLWNKVKKIFGESIEDMLKIFLTKFVGGLISGASTAGKAVSTLAGGAASLGSAITGLATGIASILPAIATGIASAAEILFAALPEILAIGAAALALYAGFMAVNALFGSISGGGGGMMDATNRELHNIWEECRNNLNISRNLKNITTNIMKSGWKTTNLLGVIKQANWNQIKLLDTIKHANWKQSELLEGLLRVFKNINFGQHGLNTTVAQPTLFIAGEAGVETVNITPDYATPASSGGIDSMNVAIEIQPVVIPRGDEYVIEFLQKSIKRGNIKIPITAVGA